MKIVLVALLVLAFFYAFYSGVMVIWSYLEVSGAVDRAWEEQGKNGASSVRAAIVKHAADAGVPLDDRLVQVGEDDRSLSVRLRWSWPVVSYQGETIVEIPLSMERAFAKP